MVKRKRLTRREFLVGVGLAAGAVYSTAIEPYLPRLERIRVSIPNLPQEFHGFQILQFTDIHRGPYVSEEKIIHGFELVKGENPALLVLTGDYVTFYAKNADFVAKEIRQRFHPPFGIFAVYGNHEYWSDVKTVTTAFQKYDLPILVNEHRRIQKDGAEIYLLGVDDVWEGKPSVEKACEGVPSDAVKILLCHEPDYADIAREYSIVLQLSGHSHGGQIRVPFTKIAYYPYLARKYPVGLQRVENSQMWVYTSRGMGNGLPVRFACPPEITVITLSSV